ncbi:MAG: class I adenylate-forming enzyme family protein, partial [Candidatus Neomarinimicrobiota bacterium]|nr:class I adenylate-forming enzyme family protein [Candidatus Neomarinimicrobiota bacterium]
MANNTVFPSTFQHLSISSGIRAAMSRNPEKQCFKHGQHTRTYKDLVSRMDRISSGFINDLKLQPDDHAAIVAGNSIEYMEIILGASQANIAMATINPKLSVTEIVAICDDAEAKVLFLDATMTENLNGIEFRTIKKIISIDDHLEQWLQKCKPMMEYPVVKEWDVFTIPYTSGTTGKPKGVLVP